MSYNRSVWSTGVGAIAAASTTRRRRSRAVDIPTRGGTVFVKRYGLGAARLLPGMTAGEVNAPSDPRIPTRRPQAPLVLQAGLLEKEPGVRSQEPSTSEPAPEDVIVDESWVDESAPPAPSGGAATTYPSGRVSGGITGIARGVAPTSIVDPTMTPPTYTQAPPPKKGMSTTAKIGIAAGIGLLAFTMLSE